MKASTSFWDSIKRTHKQVAKYGGVELSGQFKAEMDALNNDINALHKMTTDNYKSTNLSSGKASPVTLDQIEYVQSISKRLKTLADLSNLADDYKPVKIKITPLKDFMNFVISPLRLLKDSVDIGRGKITFSETYKKYKEAITETLKKYQEALKSDRNVFWKQYRLIRNPHRVPLSEITKNIDHFALYCSVGMAVELNSNFKKLTTNDQQKLLANMQFIEEMAQKDSKKVYQDLGEFFTRMSQHGNSFNDLPNQPSSRSKKLNEFFKESLSYSLEDDAQRTTINKRLKQSLKDFATRVLAGKKHGANSTLDMLYSNAIKTQDLVLNDSDGILNQAIRMGNTEGARRMLHPKYERLQALYAQYITTPGKAKQYAKSLNQTVSADSDEHSHGLGEGTFSSAPITKWMGLSRGYRSRLKQIIDLAMNDFEHALEDDKKNRLLGLIEFAAELEKGDNRVSKKETASDYVFKRLKEMPQVSQIQLGVDDFESYGVSVNSNVLNRLKQLTKKGGQTRSDHLIDQVKEYDFRAIEHRGFHSSEEISDENVKTALRWGVSQHPPKNAAWFNSLFEVHPLEFVLALSDFDKTTRFKILLGDYAIYQDEIESILRANELVYDRVTEATFDSISFDAGHSAAGLIAQLEEERLIKDKHKSVKNTALMQLKILGKRKLSLDADAPDVDWGQLKWPGVSTRTTDIYNSIAVDLKHAIKNHQYRSVFQFVPAAILDRLFIPKVGSNILASNQARPSEGYLEVKGQQHTDQDSLPVIGSDPLNERAEAKDDAPSLRGHGEGDSLPTFPERKDEGSRYVFMVRPLHRQLFLNEEMRLWISHQSYQLVVIKMLG